ncbi:hypothetical protein FB446DRAFT_707040 [Lentinula raphanica]|nr:hypothetical protein FB446DRAFT_707040 [Lentinula raphanica]
MTRRTKSRVLAILVLGAAISSSVLAAPASIPPPLPLSRISPDPFSTRAHPSQSRSVGQTSEVATLQRSGGDHARIVLRRDGNDFTIDDPEYSSDWKDATMKDMNHVELSVNLNRRTELDSQPSGSSSSPSTAKIRLPPEKVEEVRNKLIQEMKHLYSNSKHLDEEWWNKSEKHILEILDKDIQTFDALEPGMEAHFKKEEHDKSSPLPAQQNRQLREYQAKLQEIHDHAVNAYRRVYMILNYLSKSEGDKIEERALENYYTSTKALENLKGKLD